jgi:hypothetical protein
MIVFDLKCAKHHVFEAWFASSAVYERQAKAGKVQCPICGVTEIEKAPMAPNVARGAAEPAQEQAGPPAPRAPHPAQVIEAMNVLRQLRDSIEKNFDHVGTRFPEEARKIHYGEVEKRAIYGDASPEDARTLRDEGIEIGQIPWLPRHDS